MGNSVSFSLPHSGHTTGNLTVGSSITHLASSVDMEQTSETREIFRMTKRGVNSTRLQCLGRRTQYEADLVHFALKMGCRKPARAPDSRSSKPTWQRKEPCRGLTAALTSQGSRCRRRWLRHSCLAIIGLSKRTRMGISVSPVPSLWEAPYRHYWRTHGKQSARWRRRLDVSWF
jgi:hypothetical protein